MGGFMETAKKDKFRTITFITAFAALLTAIATGIMAYNTIKELGIMTESFRAAQLPRLRLSLSADPLNRKADANILATEEGGVRLVLPYYVANIGNQPAYDIYYYHTLDTIKFVETPDTTKWNSIYAKLILWPGDFEQCGAINELKQNLLDTQDRGATAYRHLFVKYKDEFGNRYVQRATWAIDHFNVKDSIMNFDILEEIKSKM
jgi:hypothetical protein